MLLSCCARVMALRGSSVAASLMPSAYCVCGNLASSAGHMLLDACALRSLELLSNSEGKVGAYWVGYLQLLQ